MQKLLRILNPKLKYLVATIIIVVPLYPKFPFINIPGTYVSIRLEDFLLFFVALVLIPFFYNDRKKFFGRTINKLVFLFLAVGLTSLVSASFLTKSVDIRLGALHWLRRVEYFIPLFLGYYAIRFDKKSLGFFVKTIMLTLFWVFVYGFGQHRFNWPIIITQNQEYAKGIALYSISGGHLNSTFAGHYDLATFLILILPMIINLIFVKASKKNDVGFKIFTVALSIAGVWLLGVTGSRISTVSFMGASSISLFMLKKYKAIPVVLVASILIFSMSSSLLDRYNQLINVAETRYVQIKNILISETNLEFIKDVRAQADVPERRIKKPPTPTPIPIIEDRSTSIRLNIEWPRAVRALTKNPLFGTGYSSITLATDNDYLRLLGEVGILGFVSFSLIIFHIMITLFDKYPFAINIQPIESTYFAGLFGSMFGVLTNAIFIDVFEASKFAIIFWLLIGIAVGLGQKYKYE